jgi:hypothetical protein
MTPVRIQQQQAKIWIFEGIPEDHVRKIWRGSERNWKRKKYNTAGKSFYTMQKGRPASTEKILPEYLRRKKLHTIRAAKHGGVRTMMTIHPQHMEILIRIRQCFTVLLWEVVRHIQYCRSC